MKKLLFFDYQELEHVGGFSREVEPPWWVSSATFATRTSGTTTR